jgi:hypothetical protein
MILLQKRGTRRARREDAESAEIYFSSSSLCVLREVSASSTFLLG